MATYYGVTRSKQYLAHYGIRGMKWGVRKAREKGNSAALRYHYIRAKMKLAKLNHDSNWYIHDLKGQAWEKVADRHKVIGAVTGARIRSKIHYLKSSDPGDLYMDRRRDKFKAEMNKAFRGTKYDARVLAARKTLQRNRRRAKVRAVLGRSKKSNNS